MSDLIHWFGGAYVASALLMLAVLAVRRPVTHLFGPGVAYALWLLPALRMILPPLPAEWLLGDAAMVFDPPRMVGVTDAATVPAAAAAAGGDLWLPLLAAWATGAVLYFAWQLISHYRFLDHVLAGSQLVTRGAGIEVRQCPRLAGPMATGVLRRLILLPADFTDRFTPEERRLALAHETAHHCRGDLVANFAGLALLSLHWFNPVAHFAYRAFRDDQEAACDATVLNAETAERRQAYGSAILKSASCRVPGAACALNHAGAMKRRILIMIDGRKSLALRLGGGVLAIALVGAGLVATATLAAPSHHVLIQGKGEAMTITRDGVTRPATPAERREIEANVARAEAGARDAARGAEQAARQVEASLAAMPVPPAPREPRAVRLAPVPPVPPMPPVPAVTAVPPVPPMPAVPPVPGEGRDNSVSFNDRDWPIDRAALRAEIEAAMADARQAVAEARVHMATAQVEARRAVAEARIARREALRDAEQARRDAAEAARAFRH